MFVPRLPRKFPPQSPQDTHSLFDRMECTEFIWALANRFHKYSILETYSREQKVANMYSESRKKVSK